MSTKMGENVWRVLQARREAENAAARVNELEFLMEEWADALRTAAHETKAYGEVVFPGTMDRLDASSRNLYVEALRLLEVNRNESH